MKRSCRPYAVAFAACCARASSVPLARVRNATDEFYYQSATPFATFGLSFGQPVRPRTYYASVTFNLGAD